MVQLLPEEYERLHREFVNAGTLDILEIAERIPIEPTKQNSPNAVVDLYMIWQFEDIRCVVVRISHGNRDIISYLLNRNDFHDDEQKFVRVPLIEWINSVEVYSVEWR